MLIQTQGDARAAMQVLNTDIQSTAQDVGAAYASSNLITQFAGGDLVEQSAASLLQQLASSWITTFQTLDGDDSAPLTADQTARLQELQSEVISDRSLVGQAISSVDWTFGDFASDVATQTVNIASQAVGAVSSALGINWTYVEIGAAAAGLLLFYALFLRVRG